jgi:coenzyme F420-reducing hydrogenase delta subunit
MQSNSTITVTSKLKARFLRYSNLNMVKTLGRASMSEEATQGLQILAYCCHYCAYAAADLAGVLRLKYPAETKIVEIPCTGRLDMAEVLHTFERGADGVLVAGCLEGDCHYQEGNLSAKRRVDRIQHLLAEIGLEPDRIQMFNLSSAMGARFAEIASEMSARIHQLGPNPLRRNLEGMATTE